MVEQGEAGKRRANVIRLLQVELDEAERGRGSHRDLKGHSEFNLVVLLHQPPENRSTQLRHVSLFLNKILSSIKTNLGWNTCRCFSVMHLAHQVRTTYTEAP